MKLPHYMLYVAISPRWVYIKLTVENMDFLHVKKLCHILYKTFEVLSEQTHGPWDYIMFPLLDFDFTPFYAL